jgi:hypothetical protein
VTHRSEHHPETLDQPEAERPAPPEVLNDPEVRRKVEDALTRVRDGRLRPGSSAEDVSRLIRDYGVDPRP